MTLSDFPGQVACVIFLQGCNLRCPFCHNAGLMPVDLTCNGVDLTPRDVARLVAPRRDILGGIVLSGGEPTIHEDLPELCLALKTDGWAVQIDTSGTNPELMRKIIEGHLVDRIAMDVKAPWDQYEILAGVPVDLDAIQRSIRLLASSGVEHEFRTTTKRLTRSTNPGIMTRLSVPVRRLCLASKKGTRCKSGTAPQR